MLGDDRDRVAFQQMLQSEADVITNDCRAHPHEVDCHDPAAFVDETLSRVRDLGKRLDAAARCKDDAGCWTERLKDADAVVRERAVLEMARRVAGRGVEPLFAAVDDPDADVQLAAVQSLEWLLSSDPQARAAGASHVPSLRARLARSVDSVAGARFVAPLERILYRLRGSAAAGARPG